jgi:hypothetical protein
MKGTLQQNRFCDRISDAASVCYLLRASKYNKGTPLKRVLFSLFVMKKKTRRVCLSDVYLNFSK